MGVLDLPKTEVFNEIQGIFVNLCESRSLIAKAENGVERVGVGARKPASSDDDEDPTHFTA